MGVYFQHYFADLAQSYQTAYSYQNTDPVAGAIHLGNMAEGMLKALCDHYGVVFDCEREPDERGRTRPPTQEERITFWADSGWLGQAERELLHEIRKQRNNAAHGHPVDTAKLGRCLFEAEQLIAWFESAMQSNGAPPPPVYKMNWRSSLLAAALLLFVLPFFSYLLPTDVFYFCMLVVVVVLAYQQIKKARAFFAQRAQLTVKLPLWKHLLCLYKQQMNMWLRIFKAFLGWR